MASVAPVVRLPLRLLRKQEAQRCRRYGSSSHIFAERLHENHPHGIRRFATEKGQINCEADTSELSRTAVYYHNACLKHDAGHSHPERPQRLVSVLQAIRHSDYKPLFHVQKSRRASPGHLKLAHDSDYVDSIIQLFEKSAKDKAIYAIDDDTSLGPHTGDAVLHGVGAVLDAVDAVVKGEAANAFAAVRPPGHHAERNKAMGFCFFNNIAIGALYAIEQHKFERVAIIDFDVHHGNGTQDICRVNDKILFTSIHEGPGFYPGTGHSSDQGEYDNVLNVNLRERAGAHEFREGIEKLILPKVDAYKPDLLLVSAGYDAHKQDPLASIRLEHDDYVWMVNKLLDIADKHCDGRVVMAMEGGYNVTVLGECVGLTIRELCRRASKNLKGRRKSAGDAQ